MNKAAVWTEDEIRSALDKHGPTTDTQYGDAPLCSCSTKVGLAGYTDFDADHFMKALRHEL